MCLDRTCTQDRSSSQADGVVKSLAALPAGSGTGAALPGALAMVFVGGSVAVSGLLADAALATTQAVRYAAACLLLVALARFTGRRLVRPRGAEWLWLLGVAVAGLVLFNVALVRGAAHAEPAVLGWPSPACRSSSPWWARRWRDAVPRRSCSPPGRW
jgi:hypothetical protein